MFSRYLWDVAPEAFIPSESMPSLNALQDCLTSVEALTPAPQPVLLIHDPELLTSALLDEVAPHSWLLNLDLHCPPNYRRFACVLEVVSEHEEDKQYARERWRLNIAPMRLSSLPTKCPKPKQALIRSS